MFILFVSTKAEAKPLGPGQIQPRGHRSAGGELKYFVRKCWKVYSLTMIRCKIFSRPKRIIFSVRWYYWYLFIVMCRSMHYILEVPLVWELGVLLKNNYQHQTTTDLFLDKLETHHKSGVMKNRFLVSIRVNILRNEYLSIFRLNECVISHKMTVRISNASTSHKSSDNSK